MTAPRADAEGHRPAPAVGWLLAELANHIQASGGEVVGIVALVNASRVANLIPQPRVIREIERKYGDAFTDLFQATPGSLTAAEATYILGFRDADALRDRAAKARSERAVRLRAKGLAGGEDSGRGRVKYALSDAQRSQLETIRRKIGAPKPTVRERFADVVADRLGDRFKQAILDDLHGLKLLEMAANAGKLFEDGRSAYKLARLTLEAARLTDFSRPKPC